jgi:excisionase family DNA binding protein
MSNSPATKKLTPGRPSGPRSADSPFGGGVSGDAPEPPHRDQGPTDVSIDFAGCATLSLAEAAMVLGVHRSTAWDLYKRGEFPVPVLQIGHRLRVTKLQLERYLLSPE